MKHDWIRLPTRNDKTVDSIVFTLHPPAKGIGQCAMKVPRTGGGLYDDLIDMKSETDEGEGEVTW